MDSKIQRQPKISSEMSNLLQGKPFIQRHHEKPRDVFGDFVGISRLLRSCRTIAPPFGPCRVRRGWAFCGGNRRHGGAWGDDFGGYFPFLGCDFEVVNPLLLAPVLDPLAARHPSDQKLTTG
ncbi:hypothetical protein GmHk_08G021853 [Glycine max]|nr:hypothetical protein GmHk_08G021853 [Glycine max]